MDLELKMINLQQAIIDQQKIIAQFSNFFHDIADRLDKIDEKLDDDGDTAVDDIPAQQIVSPQTPMTAPPQNVIVQNDTITLEDRMFV